MKIEVCVHCVFTAWLLLSPARRHYLYFCISVSWIWCEAFNYRMTKCLPPVVKQIFFSSNHMFTCSWTKMFVRQTVMSGAVQTQLANQLSSRSSVQSRLKIEIREGIQWEGCLPWLSPGRMEMVGMWAHVVCAATGPTRANHQSHKGSLGSRAGFTSWPQSRSAGPGGLGIWAEPARWAPLALSWRDRNRLLFWPREQHLSYGKFCSGRLLVRVFLVE